MMGKLPIQNEIVKMCGCVVPQIGVSSSGYGLISL